MGCLFVLGRFCGEIALSVVALVVIAVLGCCGTYSLCFQRFPWIRQFSFLSCFDYFPLAVEGLSLRCVIWAVITLFLRL